MPSVPPLWEGYDDNSEQDLLGLLDAKVEADARPRRPDVDERATRDFAQADREPRVAEAPRGPATTHHAEVFAYARRVIKTDERRLLAAALAA